MDVDTVKDQKKEAVRLDGIRIQMDVDIVKDQKNIYKDQSHPDLEPLPERDSPEEIFETAIRFGAESIFVDMINDGFTSSDLNHPQDFLLAVCDSRG